jgi:hypothetical protein
MKHEIRWEDDHGCKLVKNLEECHHVCSMVPPWNSPEETEENHEEPAGLLVAGTDSKLGNFQVQCTTTSSTCLLQCWQKDFLSTLYTIWVFQKTTFWKLVLLPS